MMPDTIIQGRQCISDGQHDVARTLLKNLHTTKAARLLGFSNILACLDTRQIEHAQAALDQMKTRARGDAQTTTQLRVIQDAIGMAQYALSRRTFSAWWTFHAGTLALENGDLWLRTC